MPSDAVTPSSRRRPNGQVAQRPSHFPSLPSPAMRSEFVPPCEGRRGTSPRATDTVEGRRTACRLRPFDSAGRAGQTHRHPFGLQSAPQLRALRTRVHDASVPALVSARLSPPGDPGADRAALRVLGQPHRCRCRKDDTGHRARRRELPGGERHVLWRQRQRLRHREPLHLLRRHVLADVRVSERVRCAQPWWP
jgi:hypothetical protein